MKESNGKMYKEKFFIKFEDKTKSILTSIILISNIFIWYSLAFNVLKELIHETNMVMWGIHFIAATFSAIVGSIITDKIHRRIIFIVLWMISGIISSLALIGINPANALHVSVISCLFGVSFGLGLPASMAFFAHSTKVENRAKLGGLILFIDGLGAFLFGMIPVDVIATQALILAIWRGCGLIFFLMINTPQEIVYCHKSISFAIILGHRAFVLYLIPWIMFSLINYLSAPLQFNILGSNLVKLLVTIESALTGVAAVVGGFFSDVVGRKRMAIVGFIMLGLGYALLGIYPENLLSWYFYTLVDGIAWGILSVIFIITVWGDLSQEVSSDKYYALGGLPFFISNFLRIIIGSYIAETVSPYAIFSLTAFFLFLAVVPLMYAPETLPEKTLKERELKSYIEKAKKIKEKYV
jgi:MFS family permease